MKWKRFFSLLWGNQRFIKIGDVRDFTFWEQLVFEKKRYLISIGAFAAGVAVLMAYGKAGPSAQSYLAAEAAFEQWSASPEDSSLLYHFQSALKKVPQMEAKYEGYVAQTLLDRAKDGEESGKAVKLAMKSLGSIQQEAPLHAAYAENSLHIERGLYQEALQRAVSLKEKMEKECDLKRFKEDPIAGGSVLYAYNLIRIACLQQKLKNSPGEIAAWEEVEGFINHTPIVLANFTEKGVDLTHYISERKHQLAVR